MTHKIILLNGPPRSGKDEAGKAILHGIPGTRLFKMSGSMKRALRELLGLSDEAYKWVEDHKELPIKWLDNMTWRQMQISMSEDWMKKILGQDVFGQLARQYLSRPTAADITAITDVGFRSEALPIISKFGVKNCLLIQLSREGCTFDNDSRSYIELDDLGVTTVQVRNHYPQVEYYHTKINMVVNAWLSTLRS